jgi:TM2 domain-containing membrane protein YozV
VKRQAAEVRPGRDFKPDMDHLYTRLSELQVLLDKRSGKANSSSKISKAQPAPDDPRRDKIMPSDPPKDPIFMCILSFLLVGLGQFWVGQRAKGLLMLLAAFILGSVTVGIAIPIIWVLSAYDAYRIAAKLRDGRPVGQWEFF